MMALLKKYFLSFILLSQTFFVGYVFRKLIFHPEEYLLSPAYDGLKNYFTYISYQHQPWNKEVFKFINMNYPYGDYIFYTDNTPLFAFLIKLFSTYIFDVTSYSLYIFNIFILSGIIISSYFLYKILQRLTSSLYLILIFSLTLPWINPQIIRLIVGHHNLSLSWIFLFAIYLLIKIYEQYISQKRTRFYLLSLILLMVLSGFIHIYYLMLLLTFIGCFFFFYIIYEWNHQRKVLGLIKIVIGICVGSLSTFFLVLRLIDKYYPLRVGKAEGYNFDGWKLNFSGLYTSYPYFKIKFLFESLSGIPYESSAYLGSFTLFFSIFLIVYYIVKKNKISTFKDIFRNTGVGIFCFLLFLSSVISLIIALGPEYYFMDGQYRFINYLNPFYYLGHITEMVNQFRCLGRFVWIFYWSFTFCTIYACSFFLEREKSKIKWMIYTFTFLLVIDTRDMMKELQTRQVPNVLIPKNFSPEVTDLSAGLNSSSYQAILPIPYYHNGTDVEGYKYAIDGDDNFVLKTMQMSLATNLPLMTAKFGRTPISYAKNIFEIFLADTLNPDLRNKLDNRPVLVFFDSSYYDGTNNNWPAIGDRQPAASVFANGKEMTRKYNMKKIKQFNSIAIYSWDLKGTR
jgi:hypothetical protein